MKYDLVLSEEARLDIIDAFSWYGLQRQGLGFDFELCLEAGLNEISRNPLAFAIKHQMVRVYFISRFPFGVHFIIEKNTVFVLAVMHTSRKPRNWENQL